MAALLCLLEGITGGVEDFPDEEVAEAFALIFSLDLDPTSATNSSSVEESSPSLFTGIRALLLFTFKAVSAGRDGSGGSGPGVVDFLGLLPATGW